MRAVVARVSLRDAMGDRRGQIENQVMEAVQRVLDSYRAGVLIQGVAIKRADPPEAVNAAFKEVSAAQQDAQRYVSQATAYAQQLTFKAEGEAGAFDKVYEQYKLAPDVTRRRMYYETMEEVLRRVDKTIIEAPGVMPILPLPRPRKPSRRRSRGNDGDRPPPADADRDCRSAAAIHRHGQLSNRAGNQAGGDRPLRQAGPDPQPIQAQSADRRAGRRRLVAGAFRRKRRVDRQARARVDMDRQQVLSTDQLRLEVDAFAATESSIR